LKKESFSFCACNYVLDTANKAKMLRVDAALEQHHIVYDTARRQGGCVVVVVVVGGGGVLCTLLLLCTLLGFHVLVLNCGAAVSMGMVVLIQAFFFSLVYNRQIREPIRRVFDSAH
jgi:hypothetical protein